MAYSVVYISEALHAGPLADASVRTGLVQLQEAAHAKNRAHGIRGLLICGADFYVQWLEGEQAAVQALMARIHEDPRHAQLQVLHEGDGPQQLESWAMTLLVPTVAQADVAVAAARLRRRELPDAEPGGMPAAIVRSLVKPGRRACGQRVGLIGQNDVWSSALMAHLADKWQLPLRRTRAVGSLGLDREALLEYLDRADPVHGPVTVVHYSGDLLATAWMQGCLAPMRVATLFYTGSSQEALIEFTDRALMHLGPANEQARLVGFFRRAAARHMPAVQAHLAARGREARLLPLALADSAAAWEEICESLDAVAPAAVAEAPAPAAKSPAKAKAAAAPDAATKPALRKEPVSSQSAAPAPQEERWRLSAVADAWIQGLLQSDGVVAAALAPDEPGVRPVMRHRLGGTQPVHEHELQLWCRTLRLLSPGQEPAEQVVIRYQSRLLVLQELRSPGSVMTLYVASEPGFTNEAALRKTLQSALQAAPPALLDRAPTPSGTPRQERALQ